MNLKIFILAVILLVLASPFRMQTKASISPQNKATLYNCFQYISINGCCNSYTDSCDAIFQNATYTWQEWDEFFWEYYHNTLITTKLWEYITNRSFESFTSVRLKLQLGQKRSVTQISDSLLAYEDSLGIYLMNNSQKRNHFFLNLGTIAYLISHSNSVIADSSRDELIAKVVSWIDVKYPQFYKKTVTLDIYTHPYMAVITFQLHAIMLDAEELTPARINYLIPVLGVTGMYQTIWQKHNLFIVDNNGMSQTDLKFVDTLMTLMPDTLTDLRLMSNSGRFGHPNFFQPDSPSVDVRKFMHACNTFATTGDYNENSFPSDYIPIYVDGFSIVVVHEVNHQLVPDYIEPIPSFFSRWSQLLNQAGSNPNQYLRFAQGGEFVAGQSNVWFTSSRHALELGLQRFDYGYHEPINQVLYMSELYSAATDTTRFFTVDTQGKINMILVPVERDVYGHINKLTYLDTIYNFTLDASGNVLSYSDTSHINTLLLGNFSSGSVRGVGTKDTLAFISSGFEMKIIDVSNPALPTAVSSKTLSAYSWDITLKNNYAYLSLGDQGVDIVDISNPFSPSIAAHFDSPGNCSGVDAAGGYAYLADGSRLRIYDISNFSSIMEVGSCVLPGNARHVKVRDNYAFVADGGSGLRVVNVSNPANPVEIGFCDTPDDAHEVALKDNLAFVADGYGGVRIINVNSLTNPVEIGFYDSPGYGEGVGVHDNFAYLSDATAGLRIIDITVPTNPIEAGYYDTPGNSYKSSVTDNLVFIADGGDGLKIIQNLLLPSISTLNSPVNLATNLPTTLSFSWHLTAGAQTYHLQVAKDSLFSQIIFNDSLLIDSSCILSSLEKNTNYFWKVRGRNTYGSGNWSTAWKFKTTEGGTFWVPCQTNTDVKLTSIYFPTNTTGWAVGYNFDSTTSHFTGKIIKTTDGGNTWVDQPFTFSWNCLPTSVYFADTLNGWVSISSIAGFYLKTTDGGLSWNWGAVGDWTSQCIQFVNANVGWLGAGNIYKSTNGGSSWSEVLTLCGAFSCSSHVSSLCFIDTSYGWVLGSSSGQHQNVHITTNGGTSWSTVTLDSMYLGSVKFINRLTGWAAGNKSGKGLIVKSTDGGISWNVILHNYKPLHSISFIDSLNGWAAGDSGLVVKTSDGGLNWEVETTNNIYPLLSIQFRNLTHGWASGENGKILRYLDIPVPVELTSFQARVEDLCVKLFWGTATEVNNYGFEIERKKEKDSWKNIGFVNGYGNSNSPKEYSYLDKNISNSGKYLYKLKQLDMNGDYKYSPIVEAEIGIPKSFELSQNYPNPFNASTKIRYSLPKESVVHFSVYNILGEKAAELNLGIVKPGYYEIEFNAEKLASGVYIYKIEAVTNNGSLLNFANKKMVLIK